VAWPHVADLSNAIPDGNRFVILQYGENSP
jgi:hypothetical protein